MPWCQAGDALAAADEWRAADTGICRKQRTFRHQTLGIRDVNVVPMDVLTMMATGLVLGVSLSAMLSGITPTWGGVVALAIGTILTLIARGSSARPRVWVRMTLGLCAGLAGASAMAPTPSEDASPSGTARIVGQVEELRARFDRADAIVRVERSEGVGLGAVAPRLGTRVRLRGQAWLEGTEIEGLFDLSPVPGFRNPTPHPPWPIVDAIACDARVIALDSVSTSTSFASAIGAVRAHVRRALMESLTEPTCGVARALILGDLALDEDGEEAVRGAGLTHVLAVSGMHVTLLVGALVWLLRRGLLMMRLAERWDSARIASAIGIPLAFVYASFAGGAPSAWRAAITAALTFALHAGGRRPNIVAVTAASVILFGIIDPAMMVRPGFLLSIAATAAILAPIDGAIERPVRAIFVASMRASIATAPVVLWCFEGVAAAGVIANVVVVPIASAILLPLAALHALVASLTPTFSASTGAILDVLSRAFLESCEAFATIPLGRTLPPLDVLEGAIVAVACVLVLLLPNIRQKILIMAIAVFAFVGAEFRLRWTESKSSELRATFLDVGQGDGALIDMPDGRLMLVDAGGVIGGGLDPGRAAFVPLLRARRRTKIDVAVITHPHPDHYGGLAALLETMEIGEIWDTRQAEDEHEGGEYVVMLEQARSHGIRVRPPEDVCGTVHGFGGASVRVLWPCPAFDSGWDANDNSFVLELTYGRRRMLLSGDAEHHTEMSLESSGVLDSIDLLKVGHHGSRTSSTPEFLAALRPRVAVVSAGRANRFGHPHPEVLERLESVSEHVLRIDHEGGVIVRTDGNDFDVRTWRGRRFTLE